MIEFTYKGTKHTLNRGVVTGDFKNTLTTLYDAAPIFSSAVEPDRDLAFLEWIGFYIPLTITNNDFDPDKIEPEHVGSMSEWFKREIEKAERLSEPQDKHAAHNQLAHGRRYRGRGSSRRLASGKDPDSVSKLKKKEKPSKLDSIFDEAPKDNEQAFTSHLMEKMAGGEITLKEGQELRSRFVQSKGEKVASAPKVGDVVEPSKKYSNAELGKGDAKKEWSSWNKDLSREEKNALRAYSSEPWDDFSTDYIQMNDYLRGKKKNPSSETTSAISQVDAALDKGTVKQNTTVYRGFPAEVLGDDPSKMIGKTITDKGYTSTSLNERVASQFSKDTIAEIRVPKGAKAGLMDSILTKRDLERMGRDPEHEMLLPRNSKFRILSSKKVGKKTKVIMELMP